MFDEANTLTRAARPDDIFYLPGEVPASAPMPALSRAERRKARAQSIKRAGKAAGVAVCLGLALTAVIPEAQAQVNPMLYISGGGGGNSTNNSSAVGTGGTNAGSGNGSAGGGAYVGDGANPNAGNSPTGSSGGILAGWSAVANDGATLGARNGGAASLTVNNLSGYDAFIQGGGGSYSDSAGAGGAATLTVTGEMTSDDVSVKGGNSGNGYGSKAGGAAALSVGGNLTSSNMLTITGGIGDSDGTGGATTVTVGGNLASDTLFIAAGGGNNGSSSTGGTTTVNVTRNLTSNTLNITGGAGNGGKGGATTVIVGGNLESSNTLSITGGDGGGTNGTGGAASLTVTDTLKTPTLTLTKGTGIIPNTGGDVSANIGTLDVTTQDTTLTLDGTTAANVVFRSLNLGGGRTLTVTRANSGDYTANVYNIKGSATYKDNNGTLNAAGKILNFYVPSSMINGQTMLTVTNSANITNATVYVGVEGRSSALKKNDTLILIDTGTGLTGSPNSPTATTSSAMGTQGVTLKYEFDLLADSHQLRATVTKADTNEQSKSLSEGFLSGLGLVNQGADLIAGAGFENALRETGGMVSPGYGYGRGTFAALSGGKSRYDTGSHVDMESFSLMAGLAWGSKLTPGRLTLGAFFEYGSGDYDTYNSFPNAAKTHGRGDARHSGGGVLGRMDFVPGEKGQAYVEASLRAGRIKNDYRNNNLGNQRVKYHVSSTYYGGHIGGGYLVSLDESSKLDLSAKYFWTRQEGDRVHLNTGDPLKFRDVDSSRVRIGARWSLDRKDKISPYAGLAWEQEFDGKAKATAYTLPIDAPSLKGGTGIVEAGLRLTPTPNHPLTIDLGIQAYAGKREGGSVSLRARWEF